MTTIEKKNAYSLNPPRARPTTVPEMVDFILSTGIKLNASDIHFGVSNQAGVKDPFLLRYRVHGKLQPVKTDFVTGSYKEIISRLKILAELNITDTVMPQDGHINVVMPEGSAVLRLATVPCVDHEEAVIRIQKSVERIPALEQLGMNKATLKRLQTLTGQKSGMIVLNGPAGSGKTTTIYSMLSTIASPHRKVITAEDPVETSLPYVTHTQTSPKVGFSDLARSFMRQDSEVIFIGEIRDPDSAEIAIQLAQTGHLVVTTLHTRDSIGVIKRLQSFNVSTSFIAATLIGSLSQRLIPHLCPACRVPVAIDEDQVSRLSKVLPPNDCTHVFTAGLGCPSCIGGYNARIPVFELLTVDQEMSEMISRDAPRNEILLRARARGMMTLAEDALLRVYAGATDLDSVQSLITAAEIFG